MKSDVKLDLFANFALLLRQLNINNAKWIYDNIPRGTKVVVY